MAAARDKVVRVENITPTVHFDDDALALGPDTNHVNLDFHPADPSAAFKLGNKEREITGVEDESNEEALESISEAADMLPPLPENWPRIPQLFVRRSWDFSTATSPAINKATNHLELLQNSIEDWFKENEDEILSRVSSRLTKSRATSIASGLQPLLLMPQGLSAPGSVKSIPKRQLRFASAASETTTSAAADVMSAFSQNLSSSSKARSSVGLSIEGVGAKADQEPENEPIFDIPYLGAEDVLDEVLALLARLENDRQETKSVIKTEHSKVVALESKIDRLATQRLKELPDSVQKEHEACAMDINELNWHVSYRSRVEARIMNKVEIANALNSKLKEDIAFVTSHIPLVQEKLELESSAMSRIKNAQTDTNDELGTTVGRHAKVESKSGEATNKADTERVQIKKDLDKVRKDLKLISEDLAEAKMTHNTYIHQCNDYRQQLADNKRELKVLEVRFENTKTAETMQATKVRELQSKIVEQEFEHRRLEDSNQQKQQKLDIAVRNNTYTAREMASSIDKKEAELKALKRNNKELEMDIEDNIAKIQGCKRQQLADEKNLVRMVKEMERTEVQARATEEELSNIRTIYNAIRQKLQKEEEKCIQEEERLKSTAQSLQKQVKEEIHSRTVIKARIKSDSGDHEKKLEEVHSKREKTDKKVTEVENAVRVILEKVTKLREKQDEKDKIISGLKSDLDNLHGQRKELEDATEGKKDELNPKHKDVKGKLLEAEKQLDHMLWKTDMMNKNMEDMVASSKMMTKSLAKTQTVIDQLQYEFDELTITINTGQSKISELKDAVSQTQARIDDHQKRHRDHMKDRNQVYETHQEEYEKNLVMNQELASKYRQLRNEFVFVKNDLLNKYEERIKIELAVKDLKQVQSLQKRMHASLQEYYKLRGLYNQSELHRMERESVDNASKVSHLQGSMDVALDDISHFLRTQMDGSTAHRLAMEKVLREERELATKVSPTTRPRRVLEPPLPPVMARGKTNPTISAS